MENIYFPLKDFTDLKFEEHTLILPLVAVGNVGQLATDLLLSSIETKLVGYIHHHSILPLVGANPIDLSSNELATSCQIYLNSKNKIVILQLRSAVALSGRKILASLLANWIKIQNFKTTIILSSCFSHFLKDGELTKRLQYISSPEISSNLKCLLEENGIHQISYANNKELELPGSGITKIIYSNLLDAKVSVLALLVFCSEGDNIPDAMCLADALKAVCPAIKESQKDPQWKIPYSWNAMFGNAAPMTIY